MVIPNFASMFGDALNRERRLAGLVACAIEAHDQAVAHELVRAHAIDGCNVLDPLGMRRRTETRRDRAKQKVRGSKRRQRPVLMSDDIRTASRVS